jgi:hypothetical protein
MTVMIATIVGPVTNTRGARHASAQRNPPVGV